MRRTLTCFLAFSLLLALATAPVAQAATRVAKCSASVNTHYPNQGSTVTVKARALDASGRPIRGARVIFAWSFKSGRVSMTKYTNASGYAYCSRNIGKAKAGYKVVVKATASSGGTARSASAWFVPKSAVSNVQNVTINIVSSGYDPTTVNVRAGVPIRLTLGKGSGCATRFRIPSLGLLLDSSRGPVTVTIPALAAGTYPFSCVMGHYTGKIVAK